MGFDTLTRLRPSKAATGYRTRCRARQSARAASTMTWPERCLSLDDLLRWIMTNKLLSEFPSLAGGLNS
jgi:hypothetical protein